jgi:hypothetical protein
MYTWDANGHIRPADGRNTSPEEQEWMERVNRQHDDHIRNRNQMVDDFIRNPLGYMPLDGTHPYYIDEIINRNYTNSQRSASPIMLDLDGDGLEITQFSGGSITFDHNADGVRTGTAWVGRDDGLLVWDRDGNGAIDSGRELFGNNTLLANGQTAADGWAALRDLDLNGDGVLDLADAAFAELRVWRDLDQDGTSDEGELFTLEALGITQIGLNKTNSTQTLADGTRLDGTGYFTINGQTQQYTDAWFAENPFYRQFATSIEVSEEVQIFPAFLGALSQQSSTRVVGREH